MFQSTSSEEDVVSVSMCYVKWLYNMFQSTSSEEDVVSVCASCIANPELVSIHVLRRGRCVGNLSWSIYSCRCFNPRPPKRTLCRKYKTSNTYIIRVSIHVLRRGRCVLRHLKSYIPLVRFQSTSSEEDVVSRKLDSVSITI